MDSRKDGGALNISDPAPLLDSVAEMSRTAELDAIYKHAPVGLALLDRNLHFVRVNEALAEMNGKTVADHLERHVRDVIPALEDAAVELMQQTVERRETFGPFELEGETPKSPGVLRTWLETWSPVFGADGSVIAASIAAIEITERKASERKLIEAAQQLKRIADLAPVMIMQIDTDLRYRFVNRAYASFYQRQPNEMVGSLVRDVIGDRNFAETERWMQNALAGSDVSFDQTVTRPDDDPRVLSVTYEPEYDDTGQIVGIVGAITDVTEQHLLEQSLRDSEARTRRVLDGTLAFIGTLSPDGVLADVNQPALDVAGLERGDVVGKKFWDCYWWNHDAEVQQTLRSAIEKAAQGTFIRYDTDVCVADGSLITIDFQIAPFCNDEGVVVELIPSGVDISDRKAAEQHRELLLGEINHRIKNSLATIQSVARQTGSAAADIESFLKTFNGRLTAMATANDILVKHDYSGADVKDMIAAQVGPFVDMNSSQIALGGPDVLLSAESAHTLGLVLHELATNASKYGALSCEDGSLHLTWKTATCDGRSIVELTWQEQGGPPVEKPERVGFGTRMIEATIVGALYGEADIRYEPEGVCARFVLPVDAPSYSSP